MKKDTSSSGNNTSVQSTTPDLSKTSVPELCRAIGGRGASADEILKAFEDNGVKLLDTDQIFKEHYTSADSSLPYQTKYSDMYVDAPTQFSMKEKTVYLTFDDGPSNHTMSILSILDKYNIKATFFVCGELNEKSRQLCKEIVKRGHTIGIHSISHNYGKIYSSVEAYVDDFYNTYKFIYDSTGVKPNIFRFPGGSINSYNRLIYKQIIAEMTRRGFVYYDWTASGEDADKSATWTSIYNNVLKSVDGKSRAVVLLHDSSDKDATVTVVEDLILALKKKGYSFDKLTNSVMPVTFGYKN